MLASLRPSSALRLPARPVHPWHDGPSPRLRTRVPVRHGATVTCSQTGPATSSSFEDNGVASSTAAVGVVGLPAAILYPVRDGTARRFYANLCTWPAVTSRTSRGDCAWVYDPCDERDTTVVTGTASGACEYVD